ncbi:MAG: thioredoxin domain-containing protein, partial [Planctomycetota bacterium]
MIFLKKNFFIVSIFGLLNLLSCHLAQSSVYAQEKHKFTNRLSKESSPYLLQHQHNPVDWYPWGEEAFAKARNENKPILVSIGYSTCHWCHVMERESFENEAIALVLNTHFVSIKVDREERPDIDNIYMTFIQRTTGSGGWPLNDFMTPEQKPFFGGTYFPPESKYGRAGFQEVLSKVVELWTTHQQELIQDAEQMASLLKGLSNGSASPEKMNTAILNEAYKQLTESFDSEFGGFYEAPKFPRTHTLSFLLRYGNKNAGSKALDIVKNTYRHMQCGGVYDHVGGGFHRYSTDREWLVPHFEKMLYDQALITRTLLELYQLNKDPSDAEHCREIFDYVLRELTSPEGGFYSAEDADSEGVEGKFYVWSSKEIETILGAKEAPFFSQIYQVASEGNFYEEANGHKTENNILHLSKPLPEVAQELGISLGALQSRL